MSDTTRTMLRAEGFTCPSCVSKIEKRVGRMPGVSDVTVHFNTSRIEVEHDPGVTDVESIIGEVAKAGYTAKASAF
ncbi:cation transporter [uncultured Corynebacterium sp.]|uniref:cation transporter n=1 Tax=uncultured Corynebacterium sp. TaxID=159447 RepID=UPI00261EAF8E|nr:heavy metal-associated domain-containing protein [uncultured Corynebacterium sp.]